MSLSSGLGTDLLRIAAANASVAAMVQSNKVARLETKSSSLPAQSIPNVNTDAKNKSEVDISINSLIGGLFLGCLCSLSTVVVLSLVLIVVTNQPFPEPVAESIGYKYPFRALQGFLTWIWSKVSTHIQAQATNLQSKED